MNLTIYFRKLVWEKFKDEENKSKLINDLLAAHFSIKNEETSIVDMGDAKEFKLVDPKSFTKSVENNTVTTYKMKPIPALTEAKVPEEGRYVQTPEGVVGPTKLEPRTIKFCKNGHPIPEGRNKCLGKGCKYS